jgi:competence protein ComGC
MTWKWIDLMIPKLSKEQFRQVYDKGFEATYALFEALQQAIEMLENRVAHLEAILAKGSHNSNKPHQATDSNARRKSLRQKSGRKSGGQNGHEGITMLQVEHLDCTFIIDPRQMFVWPQSWSRPGDCSLVRSSKLRRSDVGIFKLEYQKTF